MADDRLVKMIYSIGVEGTMRRGRSRKRYRYRERIGLGSILCMEVVWTETLVSIDEWI